jgi:hypothetical protein
MHAVIRQSCNEKIAEVMFWMGESLLENNKRCNRGSGYGVRILGLALFAHQRIPEVILRFAKVNSGREFRSASSYSPL